MCILAIVSFRCKRTVDKTRASVSVFMMTREPRTRGVSRLDTDSKRIRDGLETDSPPLLPPSLPLPIVREVPFAEFPRRAECLLRLRKGLPAKPFSRTFMFIFITLCLNKQIFNILPSAPATKTRRKCDFGSPKMRSFSRRARSPSRAAQCSVTRKIAVELL